MRRFPSSLLQFTPRERLTSLFAIGMLIGAIWYFSVSFEPATEHVVAVMLSAVATCALARRSRAPPVLFAFSILVLGATFGAGAGKLATLRLSHAQIERPMGPVSLEGWIERVEPGRSGPRLVVRVHAIDGVADAQTPRTVRLTHRLSLVTAPGRFVQCWAVLRPPPAPIIAADYAFDRQAWYAGLGGVGYVQGRCRGGSLGAPVERRDAWALQIGRMRRQLALHVQAAAGPRAGGLAAALASGDRSFLEASDQEALRRAGLAHILAISGLHIGIVGGLVFLNVWRSLALVEPIAIRWSVKKPAALAAILACAAYLVISGASVSTQRAFVMATVFFGAVLIDRAALTLRSVEIAMILIILIAPWSVLTPGFQMSFAATLALITTYEVWQRRRRERVTRRGMGFWFWLKSLVVTSAVTSFATAPFALYHFERIASLSVLANIAAMPIISLVSAPFAALALILAPVGLEAWALRMFGLSLEWVLAIAHAVGNVSIVPVSRTTPMPAASLALISAALILICLVSGRLARFAPASVILLGAALIWLGSARDRIHWAPSGDLFLEYAGGQVTRIAVRSGDGLAPLRFVDVPVAQQCGSAAPCEVTFRGWPVTYATGSEDAHCAGQVARQVYLIDQACDPDRSAGARGTTITWTEVMSEHGVTLERRNGVFQKRRKPPCGRRPWRPCYDKTDN